MEESNLKGHRHKKNKIMLLPMDGAGHVLSLLGLAFYFKQRFHGPFFVVTKPFKKYLEDTPFKVRELDNPAYKDDEDPQKRWATEMLRDSYFFRKKPENQLELQVKYYTDFVNNVMAVNDQIAAIIKEEKPELILVDYYVTVPAVVTSGIPWSCVVSSNPLCIYRDLYGPPMYSGYGFGAAKSKWRVFKEDFDAAIAPVAKVLADFARPRGVNLPEGVLWMPPETCNIYIYPFEFDYIEVSRKPPKYWTRVDHFLRPPARAPFGFQLTWLQADLKKVYFTLGTMGSADVILMDKLLRIFAKTPHQYIISKGPNHDKLLLPPNCSGSQFINQPAVIPLVDLVIFHGGNNTLVESFFHGKPMLVLPLFGDQFDNATRVLDRGFGYAFSPYDFDENLFIIAINDLLADDTLKKDLKKYSRRMRRTRTAQRAIVLLEGLAETGEEIVVVD
ncbi:uncharacterized LOC107362469 [Tetranychus urticae]|uniref:UDP-glycosyltransferase 206A1 n=1 Tax=Tetranychus urticae TaxID=32264 RepID=T1KBV2_TETUR|nr:uncharacterized LOC107362469 [Tetranychus urticae]AHX56916.1 UDP-glycosyltransferase 206A1 [Tetranychus urticae]